ncbi:MAG: hypothetical protein QOE20_4452 [Mycobacterium sp.]|nr:hypothetical protein [Mycobacterium sp.]
MDEAETAALKAFWAASFLVGGPWNGRSPGPFPQLLRIGGAGWAAWRPSRLA